MTINKHIISGAVGLVALIGSYITPVASIGSPKEQPAVRAPIGLENAVAQSSALIGRSEFDRYMSNSSCYSVLKNVPLFKDSEFSGLIGDASIGAVLFYNDRQEESKGLAILLKQLNRDFPEMFVYRQRLSDGKNTPSREAQRLKDRYGIDNTPALLFIERAEGPENAFDCIEAGLKDYPTFVAYRSHANDLLNHKYAEISK